MRGRNLRTPSGTDFLRPTQDSVREVLFSMLGAVLPDCSFLDLYAGTGAVGLEALSRGAAAVTWVEKDRRALSLLESNIASCVPSPLPPTLRVVRSDVDAWLKRPNASPASVSVAFADPPYVAHEGEADSMAELMNSLHTCGILAPRAIFVAEQRARTPVAESAAFSPIDTRRYGRTQLTLYRYEP